MEFVAIDVETANPDMASICQVGIAKYNNAELIDEWSTLINPEDYFDPLNISIHGISEEAVSTAPKFPEVVTELIKFLSGTITVCHTHFDRVSIKQALEKYSLPYIETTWLDSARVARRTWQECAFSGYSLANVCMIIGHNFQHHDALEDAKASAQVLLKAIEITRLNIEDWLKRLEQPINLDNSSSGSAIKRDGNPDADFYGEVLVFTGALEIPRREAADLAADIGCDVASGVTKKTTMLVVGDQDITRLAGKSKSSKHLKAEELIAKGQAIRILKESDFKELVRQIN
jgi:DNA polymerase-3 subunit epsilon